jgi:uncharacterized membrane protein
LAPAQDNFDVRQQRLLVALIGALVLIELLWEVVLAPVRPGGSWLALKAVPLALLWPGIARGRTSSRRIASLLLPFYIAEAFVRATTEPGRHAVVASCAATLGAAAFVALMLSFRRAR